MLSYKVVFSDAHGDYWDKRYVVVDAETGKILDDVQGYGYKSVKKAYAAYAYKTRDKSKDAKRKAKREKIRAWMKSPSSPRRPLASAMGMNRRVSRNILRKLS